MDKIKNPCESVKSVVNNEDMSVRELAEKLHKHPAVVVRWIRNGVYPAGKRTQRVKLRARRVGGFWRISQAEFDQFILDTNPELARQKAQEEKQQAANRFALKQRRRAYLQHIGVLTA